MKAFTVLHYICLNSILNLIKNFFDEWFCCNQAKNRLQYYEKHVTISACTIDWCLWDTSSRFEFATWVFLHLSKIWLTTHTQAAIKYCNLQCCEIFEKLPWDSVQAVYFLLSVTHGYIFSSYNFMITNCYDNLFDTTTLS